MDMYRLAVRRGLGREQGRDTLPACRRLLFPLLHAQQGNRRRLHAGNETRESRGRKRQKKICLLCRLGLRQGWLGWAIFSRVFQLSQKAAKKGEAFSAVVRNIWRPRVYFGYWEQT